MYVAMPAHAPAASRSSIMDLFICGVWGLSCVSVLCVIACWTCFFVLFFFALLPAPCCFAFGLKFGPLFFYSFSLCLAHFLYFVTHPINLHVPLYALYVCMLLFYSPVRFSGSYNTHQVLNTFNSRLFSIYSSKQRSKWVVAYPFSKRKRRSQSGTPPWLKGEIH